ncbi:MAG: hypothetical protein Tp156MES38741_49 [Prokaryotic dsDNA virus sp.]|nr:MAG: hypothetical protein Tp156MES38741_49 [Prokaryotic dsDNA virus sp.]|tara:strand:+ start:885 stop:1316 length:432 start_codon:yes stop_codon:yes gene_type:complete
MAGRLPDWEARLSEWIVTNRSREFAWGEWDCILMACSAVEAQTGVDPAKEYRGRYSDARGAAGALRELGKGTLLKTVDDVFERRPVGKARRGDLVMFDQSIGVCVGGAALFVGEERLTEAAGIPLREGLVTIPRALFSKAWTV